MKLFKIQRIKKDNYSYKVVHLLGFKIKFPKKYKPVDIAQILNAVCDIRLCPKARGKLRKLQIADTLLLKWFHNVCEKHNLQYFLKDGTLLGAVRHKGFIPWDDDLDISIMSDSYDDVVKILQQEIQNTNLELFGIEKTRFGNATLRISHKNFPCLNLDIFYAHPSKMEYEKQDIIKAKWNDIRNIYYDKYPEIKKNENEKILSNFKKHIDSLIEKEIDACKTKDAKIFVNQVSSDFNIMKKEWIFPLVKAPFEEFEFYIPYDADKVCSAIYGDYMSFPPNFVHHGSMFMQFNEDDIPPIIEELNMMIGDKNNA